MNGLMALLAAEVNGGKDNCSGYSIKNSHRTNAMAIRVFYGGPSGSRTLDTLIKSQVSAS